MQNAETILNIVCRAGHVAIHAGKPTRQRVHDQSLESRVRRNTASTVRREAVGKVPMQTGNSLAAYSTLK